MVMGFVESTTMIDILGMVRGIGTTVFAKASFLFAFAGAIGVGVTGYVYDYSGSDTPAFMVALLFLILNGLLLYLANRYFKKENNLN